MVSVAKQLKSTLSSCRVSKSVCRSFRPSSLDFVHTVFGVTSKRRRFPFRFRSTDEIFVILFDDHLRSISYVSRFCID